MYKEKFEKKESEFSEKILEINRITRVVKGGRRLRFRAAVIVGDRKGQVGFGVAKGTEVAIAVDKAKIQAKKNLIKVPIDKLTVPHTVSNRFAATTILLKPASKGTSLIAGNSVKSVLELAGFKDVISKTLGSTSKINSAYATMLCLKNLEIKTNEQSEQSS